MKKKLHIVSAEFGRKVPNSTIYLPPQINNDYEITTSYYTDENTHNRKFSLHPILKSKIPKMLEWMDVDADYYVWIDATFKITSDNFVNEMIKCLGDNEICLFRHPYNDCIRTELWKLEDDIKKNESWSLKYVGESIKEQVESYLKDESFVDDTLFASGFFVYKKSLVQNRDYNLMTDWFFHTCYWSILCQVSLPYLIKKHKIKFSLFEDRVYNNRYAIYDWTRKENIDNNINMKNNNKNE